MSKRFSRVPTLQAAAATQSKASMLSKGTLLGFLMMCGILAPATCWAASTVAPASLSWGDVAVGGAGGQKIVTLTNNDATAETISSIAFSGTNAGDFAIFSQTCATSLSAGSSCTVNVLFKPTATGTRTANLVFTDSASNSPQMVALSGQATASTSPVTMSPTTLAFGSVTAGSAGATHTETLTNASGAALTISKIGISGTNATVFSVASQTCGTTLASGASCSIAVLFKPAAAGSFAATLNYTSSASSSAQAVPLSGTGTAATKTVTAAPSTLAFPSVAVGSTSSSLTATLTNGTTASITLSTPTISGADPSDFILSSKTCSTTLAASASCTATLVFKPAAAGARTATLAFPDSATNSPQKVALSGTGTAATKTVTAAPSTLAFPSVAVGSTSSSLTAMLTNGTTASITLSTPTISGADPSDFILSSKTCSTTLAASASCTATLVFKPAAAGARTATLAFPDSATNSPQKVALSGTGTSASTGGTLSASPASLSWGATDLGSLSAAQTVTLHNGGTSSVSLTSVALTSTDPGDFTISQSTCGSSLGAGGSCTVTLAFKPAAAGTRVALLSFTDSAANTPQTVEVSGEGAPAPAETASITIDFGSRSKKQVSIPSNILGVEYIDSLPDSTSQNTVVSAGIHESRIHANVTAVYATSTPDWTKIDGAIRTYQRLGVHPILIIDLTPPWLVPSPPLCKTAPDTSVPSDLTKWGEMAASYVQHLDANFPGVVQDFEIWNEPNNTGALCASDKLDAYLSIYAAAAPLMKAQAKADDATIRVGGPASAGVAFPSLLTDSRTAPYVDFYSYHLYLSTPTQIADGMTWDGTGGKPSLLSMVLNNPAGEQARYLEALSYVKAGDTPLGAKMPVYFSEFNDNWAFEADCCRNDPTYSPLFNSMTVAEIFNAVYAGATQVPTKMIYYASAQKPFCVLGVPNAAMDCTPATSSAQLVPYPQLYTYQLISSPSYLDLGDGGYMASSVTLSSAAKAQGLVATAYYTATTDSILIINPTDSSFAGVTVQLNNTGLPSAQGTLYTINGENRKISSWPATLIPVTNGTQARFDMPAHTVLAVSLKSAAGAQ